MDRIKKIITKNFLIIIILLIACFLRFYRFEEFVTFLNDEGRDAIILKRIITLEHLPAIGPPTSIGQIYLGPFYYYFISPWLLIFRFNPVGPAFGVALFSLIYILVNYFIIKKLIDEKTALISSFFIAFSSVMIEFSRFSWNPNLLPLFTLLTVYFFIKSLKNNQWYFYALTGVFLSFSIQLHYLALFLVFSVGFFYLFFLLKNFKNIKKILINYSILILNFLFFTFPLLIFDLRHNFLNSKNFLNLLKNSESNFSSKINNFFDSFYFLNYYSFNISLNKFFIYFLIFLFFLSLFFVFKKNSPIKFILFIFNLIILFMTFYSGPKHSHYFMILYPLYYVLIAYFLGFNLENFFGKILVFVFIIGFLFLNWEKYPYFRYKGANQIQKAKKVAEFLERKIENKKFNFATWPVDFGEEPYLYFLELKNLKPASREKVEITNQMFVLCDQEPCQIINSPSWNISMFGKAKIDKIWKVEDLKIYKLIHEN